MKSLQEEIEDIFLLYTNETAIILDNQQGIFNQEITYKELFGYISRLRQILREKNIQSVTICAKNSLEWIIIDLACCISQIPTLVLSPVQSSTSIEQIMQILPNNPLFVCDLEKLEIFTSILRSIDFKGQILCFDSETETPLQFIERFSGLHVHSSPLDEDLERIKDELFSLICTSGSTGIPKIVPLLKEV